MLNQKEQRRMQSVLKQVQIYVKDRMGKEFEIKAKDPTSGRIYRIIKESSVLDDDTREMMMEVIKRETENSFHLPPGSITKRTRKGDFPRARYAAMYMMKEFIDVIPLSEIGASLGLTNHTTVKHGLLQCENFCLWSERYDRKVKALRIRIEKKLKKAELI